MSRLRIYPGPDRAGVTDAARRGCGAGRQDEYGPVRDRVDRGAFAIRSLFERIQRAIYIRRIEFGIGRGGGKRSGGFRAGHRYGRVRTRAGSVQWIDRPQAHARIAEYPGHRAGVPQFGLRFGFYEDGRAGAGGASRSAAVRRPGPILAECKTRRRRGAMVRRVFPVWCRGPE